MNKPQIRVVRVSTEHGQGFIWATSPGKIGVIGPDKRSVVELIKKEFPESIYGEYEIIDVASTKPPKKEDNESGRKSQIG